MPNQLGQLQDRGTTRALQTRFSVSADYNLNLMPEVAAVIPFDMPELLFHQGFRKYTRAAALGAGGAGTFGTYELVNPASSLLMIIIEAIYVDAGVGGTTWELGISGSAPADLATTFLGGIGRDTRQGSNLGSVGRLSANNNGAALVTGGLRFVEPASQSLPLPGMPLVLLPNAAFLWGCSTANLATGCTVVWRERILQEQENTV